jgi:hypothetical protein
MYRQPKARSVYWVFFYKIFAVWESGGRRAKLKHNRLQSLLLKRSDKFDRSPTVPTSVWLVRDEKRQKCRQMKEETRKTDSKGGSA